MKMRMKTRIAMMVVTLALTVVAGLAQAETRFAVQDAAGTTDKMVVTDSGYVGIGTNAPTVALHAKGINSAQTQFRAHYNAPAAAGNGGGSFVMMHNNGSNTQLPLANDRLGAMYFGAESLIPGTSNTGSYYGAGITIRAEDAWNIVTGTTYMPTYMGFETAATTTTKMVERMRITGSGNVGIGTTTPSQKLEVKGGLRVNSLGAPPTCDATIRGTVWVTQSATTAADTVAVCVKDTGSVYLWKSLF